MFAKLVCKKILNKECGYNMNLSQKSFLGGKRRFYYFSGIFVFILVGFLLLYSGYAGAQALPAAGEEFELEVTGFDDILEDGSYPVQVSSNIDGEDDIRHFSIEFSGGEAQVPVEFETAGEHELAVLIDNEHEEVITVEVGPGQVAEVVIIPSEDKVINLRQSVSFSAEAVDEYGNTITDDSDDFSWHNTDGEGLFNSKETGTFAVRAEYEGVLSETVAVEVEIVDFAEHSGNIRTLDFCPEDVIIASGSYDGTVKVWDIASEEVIVDFAEHENNIRAVAFSPEGSRIASASVDNTVKVWNSETGDVEVDFTEHEESVYTAVFSPEGDKIVSGGWDRTLKIWIAETGEVISEFNDFSASIRTADFSNESSLVAAGSWDGTVKIWVLDSEEQIGEFGFEEGSAEAVSFSPEGEQLAAVSSEGQVVIWNLVDKNIEQQLKIDDTWLWDVDYSQGDEYLLIAADNGQAMILDTDSGEVEFKFEKHADSVRAAVLSSDGIWVASGGNDESVKVWRWD